MTDRAESILASQRTYYDERAPDYGSGSDRRVPGAMPDELTRSLVEELRPEGDVLELACGTGIFTAELVRFADSVTAVDASPRMLDINAGRVSDPRVRYVEADIFAWEPDRTYDTVFFGFWLSHVPPSRLADFMRVVRKATAGHVLFVDEDDRASHFDDVYESDGVPVAKRTLADGRQFEIVKIFWRPDELEDRLRALGWNAQVHRLADSFLYGVAT